MSKQIPVEQLTKALNLVPLIGEGGQFAKCYCSEEIVKANTFEGRNIDRPLWGSIYYLITEESFSCMHKLSNDEIWFHHNGPAAEMLIIYPDKHSEVFKLGQNVLEGEQPQILVPRGCYQGTRMIDEQKSGDSYILVSTINVLEYLQQDYKAASYEELVDSLSEDSHKQLLRKLTSELKY